MKYKIIKAVANKQSKSQFAVKRKSEGKQLHRISDMPVSPILIKYKKSTDS